MRYPGVARARVVSCRGGGGGREADLAIQLQSNVGGLPTPPYDNGLAMECLLDVTYCLRIRCTCNSLPRIRLESILLSYYTQATRIYNFIFLQWIDRILSIMQNTRYCVNNFSRYKTIFKPFIIFGHFLIYIIIGLFIKENYNNIYIYRNIY